MGKNGTFFFANKAFTEVTFHNLVTMNASKRPRYEMASVNKDDMMCMYFENIPHFLKQGDYFKTCVEDIDFESEGFISFPRDAFKENDNVQSWQDVWCLLGKTVNV